MSVVIGLQHKGRVWLGGDSASVSGNQIERTKQAKVFRRGPFLFGTTGSHRGHDLLQHGSGIEHLDVPKRGVDTFIRTKFIDEVRKLFKEGAHATVRDQEESHGVDFLVGLGSRLYRVSRGYEVTDYADGLTATGSGYEIALGALAATKHLKNPRTRLLRTLEIVARYHVYVCEPFTILSTQ